MVFDSLGTGGIERVGASYAELLVEAGHEVDIINLQPDKAEMVARFPESCSYRSEQLSIIFQPDVFAALLKRPWGKYAFPIAYAASRCFLGVRQVISRLHNRKRYDIAVAFSGHVRDLTYVAYDLICADKKLAWAHGAIEDYLLLSYAFARLYEKVRNICVLSTAGQARALECFPRLANSVSITHIHNPVPQDPVNMDQEKMDYINRSWGEPLVMVGRFDADKDQATVIRSLALLRDAYGMEPHLVFVGDGPTRSSCEALVQELGLSGTIHFVGMQSDVDSYYLASKLFIHSSPAEGLPTVILEAMRDGIPVLATNSLPGVPEILGDSEFGLICKVGDPQDMASKIHALLVDEEMRKGFAESGKRRVKDFSPDTIAGLLEKALGALR